MDFSEFGDASDDAAHGLPASTATDLVGEGAVPGGVVVAVAVAIAARLLLAGIGEVDDLVGGEAERASHPGGGGHLDGAVERPWWLLRGQRALGFILENEIERGRRLGGRGKRIARGEGLEIIWKVRRAKFGRGEKGNGEGQGRHRKSMMNGTFLVLALCYPESHPNISPVRTHPPPLDRLPRRKK